MQRPFTNPAPAPLRRTDPPLLDLQARIRRPFQEPDGWHVEVRPESLAPMDIEAAIDKAFAELREKLREVLG